MGESYGVDGVIKGTTQVMRDVPHDHGPSSVRMRTPVQDMYRYLSHVSTHLRDDSLSVGLLEGLEVPLELLYVLICPVEPGLNELS
jgi:hypothetical protein